jgi:hypothetical protein
LEVFEPRDTAEDADGWAVVEVKRKKRSQLGKKALELSAASSELLPQPSSKRTQLSGQSNASVHCLTEAAAAQKQGSGKAGHPPDVADSQEDSTSADENAHVLNDATDSDADDRIRVDVGFEIASHAALDSVVRNSGLLDKVGSSSQPRPKASSSQPARSVAGTGSSVHHEVHVGIEHTVHFPVVRLLIGPGGVNMRKISSACPSTKVELRGAGTNPWLGGESGPLVLHIRGRDRLQCAEALKLANELIDGVRKQHDEFMASRAKPHE